GGERRADLLRQRLDRGSLRGRALDEVAQDGPGLLGDPGDLERDLVEDLGDQVVADIERELDRELLADAGERVRAEGQVPGLEDALEDRLLLRPGDRVVRIPRPGDVLGDRRRRALERREEVRAEVGRDVVDAAVPEGDPDGQGGLRQARPGEVLELGDDRQELGRRDHAALPRATSSSSCLRIAANSRTSGPQRFASRPPSIAVSPPNAGAGSAAALYSLLAPSGRPRNAATNAGVATPMSIISWPFSTSASSLRVSSSASLSSWLGMTRPFAPRRARVRRPSHVSWRGWTIEST